MSTTMTLKDVALKLVSYGWYVFPLGEKSKQPDSALAPHGFQSASNDRAQIEAWWTASPNANIGIDLGRSNLTVLDFDKGEPPAGLNLPSTLKVKSARGTHVYLSGTSHQGKITYNGEVLGDIKSDGGYVLAPFSVHPDGPTYTVDTNEPIPALPDGLLDKLRAQTHEPVNASLTGPPIPRGQHDTTLYKIACKLRGEVGLDEDDIYNIVVRVCENRCENYGTDYRDMCKRKAQQACKHPAGTPPELILNMRPTAEQQQPLPLVDPTQWRSQFRTVGQMEDRPIDQIITGVLQEGVTFIGANPGDGKTLVSLAFAKAICTGTPLFNLPQYFVSKPRMVIYLIPETRDPAFRRRCEAFQIPDDDTKFLARTVSAGPPLTLSDPYLMQAVKETNSVVFLDTAARFMTTNDENSAAQNRQLVDDVIALQAAGAVAVVLNHHATKAAQSEGAVMTLENMLRGTGDFAAMCDQVYGIRKDRQTWANGAGPMEIELVSLKDRELIGSLTKLKLAASRVNDDPIIKTISIIDTTGNFRVIEGAEDNKRLIDKLVGIVTADPDIKIKEIVDMLGGSVKEYTVRNELKKAAWHTAVGGKGGNSPWHKDEPGKPCPYDKKVIVISSPTASKPQKKAISIDDAVTFLKETLESTSPDGDYVAEVEVLLAAERQGIPDRLLNKAKTILGVVVEKEDGVKVWALPGQPGESGQPVAEATVQVASAATVKTATVN
jgi:hypothetical protein